jgi:TetR/AcrR family transcriptional regulator, cholesterol catabolism regulator
MTELTTKNMDLRIKIMQSALDLFRQYGFKSVTMDDVAHRSGISKKTLYQHFDNKNAIVGDTMLFYNEGMRCQCDSIMQAASNAVEAFVKIKVHFDKVYKELNPIALHELQRFYPEGYQQFRLNMESDVAAIRANLDQGVAEGLYRPEINTDVMALFHMESLLMIMLPNMIVKDRFDLYTVSREIMEHYIYGIVTAKGEKLYRKYKEQYLTK